jgi:hypothetical protein
MDPMLFECRICNNIFSSQSSLNNHQKRAKYCKKIQEKNILTDFKCNCCTKEYTSKENLIFHQKNCISYLLNEQSNNYKEKIIELSNTIEEYKKQVKELQDKLENIAVKAVSRPTNKTQINNFIQQLQPLSEEKLKESVDNLTIDHIKKGPEGYAQYALDYPLKDKMICVDFSRRKVKFKDKDGNIITDPEMSGLATKFFNSIKDKNKELICVYANELKEKLGDNDIMDTMVKIFDYKMSVDKGSDGEKTDFHHDFVTQMCSQTLK